MKKKMVTAVVVLFICVAVYLNWNTVNTDREDPIPDGIFGQSDATIKDENSDSEGTESEKVSGDMSEYFEKARLEKQKARDSAVTTLKEAVVNENISQVSRDSAAQSIETISTGALSETRIETLVKAKGYKECVALINEEGVSVIVTAPEEGLLMGDITKIKDIAVSETSFSAAQIKIIEIK